MRRFDVVHQALLPFLLLGCRSFADRDSLRYSQSICPSHSVRLRMLDESVSPQQVLSCIKHLESSIDVFDTKLMLFVSVLYIEDV